MPTYEYECRQCGLHFEKFQKMSDTPLKKCPQCGDAVQRLIGTGGAVIFKGSGFYATDYRNSKPSCGRDRPCCGRDTPCDTKPCDT
ncbi:MAG: zinc ribbon domain-containing protein [Desulfobacteraceae bacterium]|nr:zinc ribbon domain-containing protein [Desulfobacteraceae bacterium]